MTPREHIRALMAGRSVAEPGFWIGRPHPDTLKLFQRRLGTASLEEFQQRLHDDVRWIGPQHYSSTYRHPNGASMRPWRDVNPHGLSGRGLLSRAQSVADLDRVEFPDARYLDFSETLAALDAAGDYYRLSGFWSPFFHDLCYLFGTEELLILLMDAPEVVKAALERIAGFYLKANERFFEAAGDRVDALFIGNDFGTQGGLLFSPALFREHFLPWIARFAEQAHRYGRAFVLHCCGSVADIIGDLIAAGVDGLHPMQTAAHGMAPESLAERFGGQVVFWGGLDTQGLLQSGVPEQVDQEIARLRRLFGARIVIGPSHEALLPSVNIENVLQIARTLKGITVS